MKRGISFEIPNEYGSYLDEVLNSFDMTVFNWSVGCCESYFVEDGELGEPLFPEEINVIDGGVLKGTLESKKYYVIFADLKAYPKDKIIVSDIVLYEEYLNSDCQLVLLVVDCSYITIYCKDKERLERLYKNAKIKGFDDVQYITDENDTRTGLSVW
jgi:hypothetical protein